MTWQLWNGPDAAGPAFTKLAVIGDTTRGLLTTGVVKVVLPPTLPRAHRARRRRARTPRRRSTTPTSQTGHRLAPGVPPAHRPPQLGDAIGRVRWVGVNAVQATQARTATAELLGSGTGDADQTYPLSHRPVLPGTVVLEVEEAAGWVRWTEVENFVATAAQTTATTPSTSRRRTR